MKKSVLIALVIILVLASGLIAFANSAVKIYIDGKELDASMQPSIKNGIATAPVRGIAEALGASVSWDDETNSIRIESQKDDMRISLLEQALILQDHLAAVTTWAEAVKMRNGALQYALLSPDLQSVKYDSFAYLNWSTGTSSPWIKEYTVSEKGKPAADTYLYQVAYTYTDSTQNTWKSYESIEVKKHDKGWHITAVGGISIAGKITEVTTDDSGSTSSVFVEGSADGTGLYQEALVLIGEDTRIFKGYTSEALEAKDLKMGVSVEVIFVDRPMMLIYPPQAEAEIIRVLD